MEMPKFLFSKKYLTGSVVFIFLFSVLFLLVYRPFSATVWIGFSSARHAAFTLLFYAIVILVMALSKWALYHFQESHVLTVGKFIAWVMTEYFALAVIYLALTPSVVLQEQYITLPVVLKTSLCVGLIVIIPYGYLTLFLAYMALKEEYDALKMSQSHSASDRPHGCKVNLFDYKDELAISINEHSILFMKAQDNYVQIYYESDGDIHKYMLRCPTQKLEATLEGSSLLRCHRSYIVNMSRVKEIRRGHNCATLVLDTPDPKEISVSKSYYKQVIRHT